MKVEYIREQSGNYMLIPNERQTDCYEMKMIECNDIPGLLPLTIRKVNNQSTYMYQISNRISLMEYYGHEAANAVMIKAFLNSLKEALIALGEYLLRPDGLVLEAEHVFVDKSTHKVYFAYSEPKEDSDFFRALKRLFEDCILQTVDHNDAEAVTLVYGTYKRLCTSNCSIQGLFEVESGGAETYRVTTEERTHPYILPEKVEEEVEEKDTRKIYSIYAALGLMGLLFVWSLISCLNPSLRIRGVNAVAYGGICLVLAVGAFVLFRWYKENKTLFFKIKKREVEIPYEEEHIHIERPEETAIAEPYEEGTTILNMDDYMLLPVLRWKENNQDKEYVVTGDTIIGSSSEKADCVIHVQGVSRMHAKLVCMPDRSGFYIKDLNSTNATTIDGKTLAPFQITELHDHEEILLGNLLLVFDKKGKKM